jgi:DNA replication protein DnaC
MNKLNTIDQIYAQNLLDKCKGCKGIEECKQDMIGLIPTSSYDMLTHSYRLAFKKCQYARGETNTNIIMKYDEWKHPQHDQIVKHVQENRNIYLWGSVGLGKTHFLYWLSNQVNKKGSNVHVESTFEIARKTKEEFNRKMEIGEKTYMQRLQDVDYLFIDDMGNERKTEFNIIEILWPLIDYRYVNNKPTFITSNYSIIDLYNLYSKAIGGEYAKQQIAPIISRLKTFGEIELKGRNYRI